MGPYDLVARYVIATCPELRGDLIHAIRVHQEDAERFWGGARHSRPIPVAVEQRMWRLDELAEALADLPATIRAAG